MERRERIAEADFEREEVFRPLLRRQETEEEREGYTEADLREKESLVSWYDGKRQRKREREEVGSGF
jgi:hypothetical protein